MPSPDPALRPLPEDSSPNIEFRGPHRAKVRFRSDPLHLGRVKVEVPGIHKKDEDPASLPWAKPNAAAWANGGTWEVPPIGSWVTVVFEDGDHGYPIYTGGWWTEEKTTEPASKFKRWPTKIHESADRFSSGILRLEPEAAPEDAPNNFAAISPLGKRLERDDRAGRQRLVLADQLDNGMFINTEHGTVCVESWYGLRYGAPSLNGILLSSRGGKGGGFQIYNERGWRVSVSAEAETQVMELASPGGFVVRLDELNKKIEFWTPGGALFILQDSQTSKRIELRTPGNRGVIFDDILGVSALHSPFTGMYVVLDDLTNRVDVRSTGDLRLAADGDIVFAAAGNIIIDGAVMAAQSDIATDRSPILTEEFLKHSGAEYRNPLPFFKRPYEEDEQK